MLKLIKYNFKGEYKSIVFINLLFFTLSIALLIKSSIMFQNSNSFEVASIKNGEVFALLFILCLFFYFSTFIQSIYSFSKNLSNDSKYLLLSIPKKGYSLLGSNLLASALKLMITTFTTLCILILYYFTIGKKIFSYFVFNNISFSNILFASLICLFLYSFLVLIIYFATLLRKSIIKSKSFGKYLSFILSIIVFVIIIKGNAFIVDYASNVIDLKLVDSIHLTSNNFMINIPNITVNVASLIFNIIVFVLLYLTSSYILEYKSDI